MIEPLRNVYALILAGGASRRMGRPKQLLRWQGSTLLERAINAAGRVLGPQIIVVLGAHADEIRSAADLRAVRTVFNPDWPTGMASSIKTGIEALPEEAEAVLILLCDQPLIGPNHFKAMLDAWRQEPGRIVASQYASGSGVPVLFPADCFERLRALTGDQGAKRLLAEAGRVHPLPLAETGLDIDAPADYERLTGHAFAEGELHDNPEH